MALTRRMLQDMEIEDNKIDRIIAAHTDTVNGLKDKIEGYEADLKKISDLEKELEEAKKTIAEGSEYKSKYEKTKTEFDDFKKDQDAKATKQAKENAYRKLLKDAHISEKRIDTIVKASADAIEKIELDGDGKVKNADAVTKGIETEWADFKQTTSEQGASVATPPENSGTPKPVSRAAGLEAKYHANLYGENKGKED